MDALSAETVREIESLVTDWLTDTDVPGASVVLVTEDGEQYAEGFGARDIESNAPATPETLYGMGSITKSVTALAIIQLAERTDLSVEDSVNDYVDHYVEAPGQPITIAELLSHTSGMPANPTGGFTQALEGLPSGIADESDMKRFVRDSTAYRATDGERFFYYNTGYHVLGEIIEAVDGRTYSQYITQEVFDPLGMDRATFDPDVLADDDDAMTGYRPGEDEEPPEPTRFPLPELDRPAGGLIASVRSLSRFLRAMMTDGSLNGTSVCSADDVAQLQQGRVVMTTFMDGTELEYGYGWRRQQLGDDEIVGHGGSILTSTSFAGYLEDAGLGVVVACNTAATPDPGALGKALLAAVTGRDETVVPAFALREKSRAVSGTYEAFREEFTITVEAAGAGVSVTFESPLGAETFEAFPATLDPEDHEYYTITGRGAREPLEFDLGGEQADLFFQRHRVRRKEPGS